MSTNKNTLPIMQGTRLLNLEIEPRGNFQTQNDMLVYISLIEYILNNFEDNYEYNRMLIRKERFFSWETAVDWIFVGTFFCMFKIPLPAVMRFFALFFTLTEMVDFRISKFHKAFKYWKKSNKFLRKYISELKKLKKKNEIEKFNDFVNKFDSELTYWLKLQGVTYNLDLSSRFHI